MKLAASATLFPALALALAALAPGPVSAPAAGDEPLRVIVERVEVLQIQTYPVRVSLVVSGRRAPGVPVDVAQERKGNDVVVTLSQAVQAGAAERGEAFELRVRLQGGFATGRYTLRVNDHASEFEV